MILNYYLFHCGIAQTSRLLNELDVFDFKNSKDFRLLNEFDWALSTATIIRLILAII